MADAISQAAANTYPLGRPVCSAKNTPAFLETLEREYERVFVGPTEPQTFEFSEVGDPTTWSAQPARLEPDYTVEGAVIWRKPK